MAANAFPQRFPSLSRDDYTIGWISALAIESAVAAEILDEEHEPLPNRPGDNNQYVLGKIGPHNVVMTCINEAGGLPAHIVAGNLTTSFDNVRYVLMVGIGGGIPNEGIRLGDVVVSEPMHGSPGVVQSDFGKWETDGFKWTGSLNRPAEGLIRATGAVKREQIRNRSKIHSFVKHVQGTFADPKAWEYQGRENDPIYKDDSEPRQDGVCPNCEPCETEQAQLKPHAPDPKVHYGIIASGNQVIKSREQRDKLRDELKACCVEMEAFGLMNSFPCLVIRGISDYADGHKNDKWQCYAALTAAAYAKELLLLLHPSEVERTLKFVVQLEKIENKIDEVLKCTVALIRHQEVQQEGESRNEILKWLTSIDYATEQSDFIRRRQEGTGQWLLNSDEFQSWLNQSKQTLFCQGMPGAGKTIITSIVVEHLSSTFENNASVGIAYLYCNFRKQDEQRPQDLLATLLKQLVRGQSSVPESMKKLYEDYKEKRALVPFAEISKELHSIVAGYQRTFIIIDALDECKVSHEFRDTFLSEIFSLRAESGVNIFATSRFIPAIEKVFEGSIPLRICAHNEDVRKYLDGHMSSLSSYVGEDDELKEKIKTKIIEAVGGMFLLAQLHLNSLKDKMTPYTIEGALEELPKGSGALDNAYEEAMGRVETQMRGHRDVAKRALSWITFTKRPITTLELQHALAVEVNDQALNEKNFPKTDEMVSICAGLVTTEESGIIRLVHYTTQEYFERTWTSWFPNAQMDITNACVTYLSFNVFETGFCQSDREFEARLQTNALYDYAARNWGHHAYTAPIEEGSIEEDLILNLLKSRAKVSAASQAMMASGSYSGYSQRMPGQMTGIHVAAHFGLVGTTIGLLKSGYNPDLRNSYGHTPLSWAAQNGHEAVVKLLLATEKVDVDSKDRYNRTPLSWAAQNGHEAVVKLLLATEKVDVDSKDRYNRTPLSWAAQNGHEAVVKLLLAKDGVDINSKDSRHGQTALSLAADRGHEAVVELLLAKDGVDINSKDSHHGLTALSLAAGGGYHTVVKLLLANSGIDINSKDSDDVQTIESLATDGFLDTLIMEMLVTSKVDIISKDSHQGRTALLLVAGGHEAVVKLLLAKDEVDINSKDSRLGLTALSLAAVRGHEAVVKLLLAKDGVDINSRDSDHGLTALSLAAVRGHEAVVKLLLAKDAVDINSKDSRRGLTALSMAADRGHEAVVKLLLAKDGVDINSKDSRYGLTALSWAAYRGHEAVVKLLLAKDGVDINSKDSHHGRTALLWAADRGHEAVVKLLLMKDGVDINAKFPDHGLTVLLWAAGGGREAVVKLLLAKDGIDINAKDSHHGLTALSWAAGGGHEAVVKLLLAKDGIDINAKDSHHGLTALSLAAAAGHDAVVKLLESCCSTSSLLKEIE